MFRIRRNLDRPLQQGDHPAVGVSGAPVVGIRNMRRARRGDLDCVDWVEQVGPQTS